MKVHGPQFKSISAYQNQLQHRKKSQQNKPEKDQLQISQEAKQLQNYEKNKIKRSAYVQEIKQAVQSDKYKIDYEQTARNMIDFWSKK